ncbi:MAG: hypothetical protein Q8O30_13540 [Candidatus Omnitrophota bacterium]|nr:hypothetical protein [Candidatus Omnitrophota bacterium]
MKTNPKKNAKKIYVKPCIIAEEKLAIAFCKICCAWENPNPKVAS